MRLPPQHTGLPVITPRLSHISSVASCHPPTHVTHRYAFVIEWTPALTLPSGDGPPHGLVFSCFMIAYMAGSVLFGLLSPHASPSQLLICFSVLSLGAVGGTFLLFHTGASANSAGVFSIFLLLTCFEAGIGGCASLSPAELVHHPHHRLGSPLPPAPFRYMAAIATLKASHVPDDLRATVYNLPGHRV